MRVKQAFDEMVALDTHTRAEKLNEICNGDNELRAEVIVLLEAHDDLDDFIEEPAFSVADAIRPEPEAAAGKLIGHYRVVREIGRGGMGTVFLAARDDGEFRQEVAIKVVSSAFLGNESLRRFRQERQILAGLNHPNIARLLDGGVTDDGLPYFVMEYVDGVPFIDHANGHCLSIHDRLKLFLKICRAISYADTNLIVHRDIKPSNILVTADGEPKLLDFGLAKVTDVATDAANTATNFRALTPAYASPEQLRGEPVTTASDVYSLGVVLYELLTSRRPFDYESVPFEKMVRMVSDAAPERPSSMTREASAGDGSTEAPASPLFDAKYRKLLRGDIDNIVLMAMRSKPERRYRSVERFADDIERHLSGQTIAASEDTFAYRSTKFINRHRIGVAAAALIVISLVSGIFFSVREGLVAQRRFNQVRKLANSVIFEFHDSIENLPGSTQARELLVKRALEYLDSLAQEAGDDPSLQRELIAAYLRIGNVQGNPNNANLGDTNGAMNSYRKALAIAESLAAKNPAEAETQRSLASLYRKMSDVQSGTGDLGGALESAKSSLAIFKELADVAPGDAEAQQSLAISYIKLGDILGNSNFPNLGDRAAAAQNYRLSLEIWQSLYSANPNDFKTRRYSGLIFERIGSIQEADGDLAGALDTYSRSLQIREPLAADYPTNIEAIRDAAIANEKIGNMMAANGNLSAGMESLKKSLEIFRGLAKADPQNLQAQISLAISSMHMGDLLGNPDFPNLGRRADALRCYESALETLQSSGTESGGAKVRSTLGEIHERIASMLELEGKTNEADAAYQRSLTLLESLVDSEPGNVITRRTLAVLYARLGQHSAILAAKRGVTASEQIERWRSARLWYQRSLATWQELSNSGTARSTDALRVGEVQAAIERCSSTLAKLGAAP